MVGGQEQNGADLARKETNSFQTEGDDKKIPGAISNLGQTN